MRKKLSILFTVIALLLGLGAAAYSGVFTPAAPAVEGVTVIQPTDGGLEDLEHKLGRAITAFIPRNQKMDYEIIQVNVLRSRFDWKATSKRADQLRFWDLTGTSIEDRVGPNKDRPVITAILTNGSLVRFPRNLNANDVKIVTVYSGKKLRIINLI